LPPGDRPGRRVIGIRLVMRRVIGIRLVSVASEAFVASSVSPVASSVLSVLSAGSDVALSAFVVTVVPADPGCA
jgi:hypothetical protein